MFIRQVTTVHVAFIIAAVGCTMPPVPDSGLDSGDTSPPPPVPELAKCTQTRGATEGILRERCGACHDNGRNSGKLGSITDLEELIDGGYVVRGAAGESLLYKRVESGDMPVGGSPLDADDLKTIADWIDECTVEGSGHVDPSLTEGPQCPENEPTGTTAVLEAIRRDLNDLDTARQGTTRYLVFTHLYGAGYCESQIEGYRHALAKLINHLSLAPYVQVPEAIDEARTIYRIDLVDYGWTTETWAKITCADPYAIVFESDDAKKIRADVGAEVFQIKGDWFIEAASQPPLYHEILELPRTRIELEQQLGIDVDAGIADELVTNRDDVLRAAFQDSKVSDFNRAIERHQLPGADYRAYWLSYDFGSNNGLKSILDHPLDFVEDGGEIIFTLPNGLQGYMIVDAQGRRIDRAPIEIVHDSETIEEPEVINGLSCMSCHSTGMRLAYDEVRSYVYENTLFGDEESEQIFKLYADREVFARAQQKDIETFANSLSRTGAPQFVGTHEPVMAAHLAFDEPLDLRRVAAEFGVPEAEVLKNVGGLQGLTKIDRATVDRTTFQINFKANAVVLKRGGAFECTDPGAAE